MSNRPQKPALQPNPREPRLARPRAGNWAESLESRLLLSAHHPLRNISGRVFDDLIGNGIRRPKDHWLAGVTVFIDLTGNGVQDAADPATVTNKSGTFTFRRLAVGIYDIDVVPPAGDAATVPATGVALVNVTKHGVLNLRFGDHTVTVTTTNPPPDTSPPGGGLSATAITTGGYSPYRFSVTWTDPAGVNVSSFGDDNVIVTGPGGYDQPGILVALDATTNGSPRTTTYQIPAPAAGWTVADDGTYTVTLQGGQISDTLGNTDPTVPLGTFPVTISSNAPGAPALVSGVNGATAQNNSSASSEISFDVSNTVAGAQLTLDADGLPIGSAVAMAGSTIITSNGQSLLSDGSHQFSVAQTLADGTTAMSPPTDVAVDTTGPTASLQATTLTAQGGSTYTFTVTYADATAVSVASLATGNLVVSQPGGKQQTPTLVSVNSTVNGPTLVATYQISAPGGSWTKTDDGSYSVTLLANQVFDEVHNAAVTRLIGTFAVTVGEQLSPATGTPALLPISDTGAFDNDGVTDLNNRSSAEALQISVPGTQGGAVVKIFADGTPIGSATATGTTTVVTTDGKTKLTDGTHLLTAEQTDPGFGPSSASTPLGIVVDTQPPTATSSPASVSGAGATSYTFLLVYRDNIGIDVAHLGTNDVAVTGPNGFDQIATFQSVNSIEDGSPRTATYSITPPGGSWQPADDGTYSIVLRAAHVFDTAGNPDVAATLGTFTVNAGISSSPIPSAPTLTTSSDTGVSSTDGLTDLNNSSAPDELQFNVGGTVAGATVTVYADGTPIGAAVATGTSTVVTTNGTVPLSDGPHTMTARQAIPGSGQSTDSAGTSITIDTSPPTASALGAPNVTTAGGTSYTFTVTYVDNVAVDAASLGSHDVTVTGPSDVNLPVTFISASPDANGSPVVGTYEISPPDGAWSSADNGTYTVKFAAGQVRDTAGNSSVAIGLGSFGVNLGNSTTATPAAPTLAPASDTGVSSSDDLTNLNNSSSANSLQFVVGSTIPGATVMVYADGTAIGSAVAGGTSTTVTTSGNFTLSGGGHTITARQTVSSSAQSADSAALSITIDTSPPTASALGAPDITTGGGTSYTFTVTYGDNVAVDVSSLGNHDVTVAGPTGTSLPVTFISASPDTDTTPVVATYQISPPDGAWSSADNGTYTVKLASGQVRDTAGNDSVAIGLGSFNVNIADLATASPSVPNLAAASDTGASASDNLTNLNNSSSSQSLQFIVGSTIPGATVTVYADGAPIGSAVASGASTTVTTNGNFTLTDGTHGITATQQSPGAMLSAVSGTLTIDVEASVPTASTSLTDITSSGGTSYTFTVTYTDVLAVDPNTLTSGNILVTSAGGYVGPAMLISTSSSTPSSSITVTYQIVPSDGAWSTADNSVYTVTLQANQVYNTAGTPVPSEDLGTFNVNIAPGD